MSRTALAYAILADGDAQAAVDVITPVLAGSAQSLPLLLIDAFLLDALARNIFGDSQAGEDDVNGRLSSPNWTG